MPDSQSNPESNRLRWQCRRGLLELDVMFNAFLDHGYDQLDAGQRQVFQAFLLEPDPQLLAWLMNPTEAMPDQYATLIQRIRHSAMQA